MKNTLLSACILFIIFSCSSSGNDPEPANNYFLRFKLNGQTVEYPFVPNNLTGNFNVYDDGTELYATQITGRKELAKANENQLSVFLADQDAFEAGLTYADDTDTGDDVPMVLNLGYFDSDGLVYFSPNYGSANITFTEVTGTTMKGNFTATVVAVDLSGGTVVIVSTLEITEGVFYVPRFEGP